VVPITGSALAMVTVAAALAVPPSPSLTSSEALKLPWSA
jgi:hypothetical protein